VVWAVRDDAHRDPVRRVRTRERVDDVEILSRQELRHLVAEALEVVLGQRVVPAPPDAVLGVGLADDVLVLRRAAREPAGVEDDRTAFGEPAVAARERVRVEQRGRRIAPDAAGRMQSVVGEIDRDRELRRDGDGTSSPRFAAGS
jgi:hypothetical protein